MIIVMMILELVLHKVVHQADPITDSSNVRIVKGFNDTQNFTPSTKHHHKCNQHKTCVVSQMLHHVVERYLILVVVLILGKSMEFPCKWSHS